MPQLDPLERLAVVEHCEPVLAATVDELEYGFRQATFRRGTEVIDVQATIKRGHGFLLRSRDDEAGKSIVKDVSRPPAALASSPAALRPSTSRSACGHRAGARTADAPGWSVPFGS